MLAAIQDPVRHSQPILADNNTEFWSLFKLEETEPSEEMEGYKLMSLVPSLCKKGSSIHNKLKKMKESRFATPAFRLMIVA